RFRVEGLWRIEAVAAAGAEPTSRARQATAAGEPAAPAADLTPPVRRLLAEHDRPAPASPGRGRYGGITVQKVLAHLPSRAAAPARPESARIPSRRLPHTAM